MPGAADVLLVTQDGPVVTLTMNRPEKLNAVDYELHEALAGIWQELERRDDVRAVILTGAGRAFCAGGDVEAFAVLMRGVAARRQVAASGRAIVTEMLRFPVPVIAAVNGPAVGLGCSLALLSDAVIMSDTAFLADNHIQYGLVPGDGGFVWPMLTGMMQAKLPLFLGDRIDATEAHRLGLATMRCSPEDVLPRARETAERIAAMSTTAIRATKRMLNLQIERAILGAMDFAMAAETAALAGSEATAADQAEADAPTSAGRVGH
jgi:enoyl-CoA hydratase